MEIQGFWKVTPRRLADSYRRFGGSYCHLHGLRLLHPEDTIFWNAGNYLPVDMGYTSEGLNIHPYNSLLKNILISFSHLYSDIRSVLLPSGILSKNEYALHLSYAIYMPAQLNLLDFIAPNVILCKSESKM